MNELYHDNEEFIFVEKYRPRTINECILPPRLKRKFQDIVDKKDFTSFTLAGSPGSGKTTIAKALCNELGLDVMVINASLDINKSSLRTDIAKFASTVSMFSEGRKKVIILDEADYLDPSHVQPPLRGFIEEFSDNCLFILTCNYKNKLIPALHSRAPVTDIVFKSDEKQMLMGEFMKKTLSILDKENIEYDKQAVAGVIKKNFPDFRKTLTEIQQYSMSGRIDSGILVDVANLSIDNLVKQLSEKKYGEIVKWSKENADVDFSVMLRRVYDAIQNKIKHTSSPEAVLIISDYQYKSAFSTDQELNFLACMVELMSTLEWK